MKRSRAACAVGATTAVLGIWASPSAASTKDVVGIGDSLMYSSQDELVPDLSGWTVTINAMGGTGLTPLTPAVQMGATLDWAVQLTNLEAQHDPAVVVVVLGTNDVFSVEAGDDYAPQIDRLMAATDAPRVLWTTCSTHTNDTARNAACVTINQALADATVRHPTLEVVDMDNQITTVPENMDPVDGIHLSATGQQALAQLVSEQIGKAPK